MSFKYSSMYVSIPKSLTILSPNASPSNHKFVLYVFEFKAFHFLKIYLFLIRGWLLYSIVLVSAETFHFWCPVVWVPGTRGSRGALAAPGREILEKTVPGNAFGCPGIFCQLTFCLEGLLRLHLMGALALWQGSKVNDHLLHGIILQ